MAGYVYNAVPVFFSAGVLPAREASSFCDFWKMTSCNFTTFVSFVTLVNLCFLGVPNKDKYC